MFTWVVHCCQRSSPKEVKLLHRQIKQYIGALSKTRMQSMVAEPPEGHLSIDPQFIVVGLVGTRRADVACDSRGERDVPSRPGLERVQSQQHSPLAGALSPFSGINEQQAVNAGAKKCVRKSLLTKVNPGKVAQDAPYRITDPCRKVLSRHHPRRIYTLHGRLPEHRNFSIPR
jgi:hypothetical protein